MQRIDVEEGLVKIGDHFLPGIFKRLRVDGQLKIDAAETASKSGEKHQVHGWEKKEIVFEIQLIPEEDGSKNAHEKLREIEAIFKRMDEQGKPIPYRIINTHTRARGIDQVYFSAMGSEETNQNNILLAILQFREFSPPELDVNKREAAAGASSQTSAAGQNQPGIRDERAPAGWGRFATGMRSGAGQ